MRANKFAHDVEVIPVARPKRAAKEGLCQSGVFAKIQQQRVQNMSSALTLTLQLKGPAADDALQTVARIPKLSNENTRDVLVATDGSREFAE
mmetsp:Transcript_18681/g.46664  ORF Transcript_18681/g.46664 Transcript_18681/m.46664 type:complete len:92 (-) Transcript_18681:362-637(-)